MIVFENDFCCFALKCRAIKNGQFKMSFKFKVFPLFILTLFSTISHIQAQNPEVMPGAWRTELYFDYLKGKKIAVVANPTSTIGSTHLVDSMLASGIQIQKVFGPEHGFRGNAANGEDVHDEKDPKTGLPVISLYGPRRKPSVQDLSGLQIVVFDLQDVGVRFYTHLTTLHFMMQRCAELNIEVLVLDRPNPNGYYVDGPTLDTNFRSDVGQHPIPLVHGMTLGELAGMINGKGWLGAGKTCNLRIIKIKNWDHNTAYVLPIAPSPNLASQDAIIAYPTMGLFEGIDISVGRGTPHPFECFGAPWLKAGSYVFVPKHIPGKTINPPYLNDTCRGFFIKDFAHNYLQDYRKLYIEWLELLVNQHADPAKMFNPFFDKLSGGTQLRQQLLIGMTADAIRNSWQPELEKFIQQRQGYMLYAWDRNAGILR
jgi:uncharacterized protein YbbC (DUF1343 family)